MLTCTHKIQLVEILSILADSGTATFMQSLVSDIGIHIVVIVSATEQDSSTRTFRTGKHALAFSGAAWALSWMGSRGFQSTRSSEAAEALDG